MKPGVEYFSKKEVDEIEKSYKKKLKKAEVTIERLMAEVEKYKNEAALYKDLYEDVEDELDDYLNPEIEPDEAEYIQDAPLNPEASKQ